MHGVSSVLCAGLYAGYKNAHLLLVARSAPRYHEGWPFVTVGLMGRLCPVPSGGVFHTIPADGTQFTVLCFPFVRVCNFVVK